MSARSRNSLLIALSLAAGIGCAADGSGMPEGEGAVPSEESDLVAPDAKNDTGYYSNLATELEGELRGEIRVAADDETRRLLTDEDLRQSWAGDQLKYAKNTLNADKLHLNLGAGDLHDVAAREEGGEIIVTYAMRAETIVSFEELRAAGIEDPASLQDRRYEFRTPADPRNIFARAGERCAEGFDAGSLADYNYFYYWKPEKAGCDIATTPGTFTVRSLLPSGQTYPEYDQLIEDGRVTVVAFFGQADHEPEVSDSDWGMINLREFESALRSRGFRQSGVADADTMKGKRWTRTRGGLEQIVDVISPKDLNTLQNDTTNLFGRMVRTHEVVMYLGHSFYGSLRQLDDPANYAPDTYQIFLMGSCWSYEYYTKQIFRNKANEADPTGWARADVVNDTEMGWFHNMAAVARILMTNVFEGAEKMGRDGDRRYHWQNIIDAMNRHALEQQRIRRTDTHEIFGVSGVRTNRFDPDGTAPPVDPEAWERAAVRVESPHAYGNNLMREFTVTAPEGATSMRIHFERLETEQRYDFVEVYDATGNRIARYDGRHTDLTTEEIRGATATIKLITDGSVTAWGFAVDHVLFKRGGSAPPPATWMRQATAIESAHPYADSFDMRWDVQAPTGAREMRIHFVKIDTEARYDFVELYDAAGTLITRWDGAHTDLTTAAIPGGRAQVRLVTDDSVTRWGFQIDRIEYR